MTVGDARDPAVRQILPLENPVQHPWLDGQGGRVGHSSIDHHRHHESDTRLIQHWADEQVTYGPLASGEHLAGAVRIAGLGERRTVWHAGVDELIELGIDQQDGIARVSYDSACVAVKTGEIAR